MNKNILYTEKGINHYMHPVNIGRMRKPDSFAIIKGMSGETIEIYMKIMNDRIAKVTFYTDGCGVTNACCSAATTLAKGKKLTDALDISPTAIINELETLSDSNIHRAILVITTLHLAIADFYRMQM